MIFDLLLTNHHQTANGIIAGSRWVCYFAVFNFYLLIFFWFVCMSVPVSCCKIANLKKLYWLWKKDDMKRTFVFVVFNSTNTSSCSHRDNLLRTMEIVFVKVFTLIHPFCNSCLTVSEYLFIYLPIQLFSWIDGQCVRRSVRLHSPLSTSVPEYRFILYI